MISISTICNNTDRVKIAKAKEEKKQQLPEIDYEAKEYQGSYADDEKEEECQ